MNTITNNKYTCLEHEAWKDLLEDVFSIFGYNPYIFSPSCFPVLSQTSESENQILRIERLYLCGISDKIILEGTIYESGTAVLKVSLPIGSVNTVRLSSRMVSSLLALSIEYRDEIKELPIVPRKHGNSWGLEYGPSVSPHIECLPRYVLSPSSQDVLFSILGDHLPEDFPQVTDLSFRLPIKGMPLTQIGISLKSAVLNNKKLLILTENSPDFDKRPLLRYPIDLSDFVKAVRPTRYSPTSLVLFLGRTDKHSITVNTVKELTKEVAGLKLYFELTTNLVETNSEH